jgi:hypothetical protein
MNTKFVDLNESEASHVQGGIFGGFAYDMGRFIRLIGLSGGGLTNPGGAMADWYATGVMNN